MITGIGAIVFGAILTLVGIAGRNLGPLLIGLTFAVAGIATLRITRMGTIWSGLDWEDKAGAWPGIVIGAVPFLCYVIYIRLMVLVADMVRRQPR
ncbi:hypothetical protein [Streptomyces sp. NPDC096033]|uniref:hypothetical protein n=1 Tax=Streptomyces sp. NPDC096033 TaxID=3366071 RepID=UPI0037FD136D